MIRTLEINSCGKLDSSIIKSKQTQLYKSPNNYERWNLRRPVRKEAFTK